MTDIDTALLDALVESISSDMPIARAFTNACTAMSISAEVANERAQQLRQMQIKMTALSRPARRIAYSRLVKKLMIEDKPDQRK
jgi:hypothetical protein